MGNRVRNVRIAHRLAILKPLQIINILLRANGDAHHRLERLDRIHPGSRFAGGHRRARSVVNRIRNVGRLCTGRSWMLHHGIEHLRRRDNDLSCPADLLDNHFLDDRNILERNLHAHIAAGHHDAVRYADDFVNVLHALHILDLRDNVNTLAALFLKDLADREHIVRRTHE